MCDVNNMQQYIGPGQFLQGGLKRRNQLRRKFLDKAHGIAEEHLLIVGQGYSTGGGIQSGEKLVFDEDLRAAEGIKQGAFARIGIADQGDNRDAGACPMPAVTGTMSPYPFDLTLEVRYSHLDDSAVGFELFFPGAPGADAAAETPQMWPETHQAGQEIFVLRQLYLKSSFMRLGTAGEDVQNQRRAVENLYSQCSI